MRTTYLRPGFTLIEVVVVIAIIGISAAVILVPLSNGRASREAERAAHVVSGALRESQNSALVGRASLLTEENCYFGIQITSATTYRSMRYARNGATCGVLTLQIISTSTLPGGVQFSGIANYPFGLFFAIPRANVASATGAAIPVALPSGTSQRIILTKSGQNRSVCLYSTGRIEEIGSANACP